MKITKSELRLIIKEELNKLNNSNEIEVSLRYALKASNFFKDSLYRKLGKQTASNSWKFKTIEDANNFKNDLVDEIDIPEDEIELK